MLATNPITLLKEITIFYEHITEVARLQFASLPMRGGRGLSRIETKLSFISCSRKSGATRSDALTVSAVAVAAVKCRAHSEVVPHHVRVAPTRKTQSTVSSTRFLTSFTTSTMLLIMCDLVSGWATFLAARLTINHALDDLPHSYLHSSVIW